MILRSHRDASPADSGQVSHNRPTPGIRRPHPPAMGDTEGLWSLGRVGKIPQSQCHNAMIFMKDGGPARARTWDQGIMSRTNRDLI